MIIFLIVAGVITALCIISAIANKILSKNDFTAIFPYGKLVDVDGKHMARLGRNAKSITLNGNHMLHIATWKDVLKETKNFLNQVQTYDDIG
ncbi:MAG: hypothetical protein FWC32_12655 [Firmicutes bacterium]|nr:hypothetical protein [Bacillota bacterium]